MLPFTSYTLNMLNHISLDENIFIFIAYNPIVHDTKIWTLKHGKGSFIIPGAGRGEHSYGGRGYFFLADVQGGGGNFFSHHLGGRGNIFFWNLFKGNKKMAT